MNFKGALSVAGIFGGIGGFIVVVEHLFDKGFSSIESYLIPYSIGVTFTVIISRIKLRKSRDELKKFRIKQIDLEKNNRALLEKSDGLEKEKSTLERKLVLLSVSSTEKSYLEEFVKDFSIDVVNRYFDCLSERAIPLDFFSMFEKIINIHGRKHNELSNSQAEEAKSAFIASCVKMDEAFSVGSELNNNTFQFIPKILGKYVEEYDKNYKIRYRELGDSFTELRRVFKKAYPWLEWK
ncbi:hypothetical protein [Shouchella clausii]|uniref:DUF4760 domain-containing protein n=1 Tax=Shouchella clausii TaxID=79880 RepID=A0A268NXB0_SHOCL|nr:hypothetical protein [Shouchella clausii]PAE87700.1 hypothetical protein CHH72_17185 [Shouchella clausii]